MQRQAVHRVFVCQSQVGFSLLELLIVMLIMGVILGAVGLNAAQTSKQILQQDVRRLAALMQLARDEAIVRNRLIALELDTNRYGFFIKIDNAWEPLKTMKYYVCVNSNVVLLFFLCAMEKVT